MRINYIHLWSFMLYTNNAWKLYNFNRCHLRSIKYVLKNGPHLEASHQHPVWPSLPQGSLTHRHLKHQFGKSWNNSNKYLN
jgi:hypothetical protein